MIPGRFDRRLDPRSGRTLILDGAHTAGSIAALIEAAAEDTDVSRFPFIVNLLADKPASDILGVIAPHATVVVFPRSANARAWPSATLVALARELGTTAMESTSLRDAIDTLPVGTEPVLITGSFGIVADGLRMFESQV
jgi:folylpolyglutamate synthase/dihydropteroate synthase